MKGILMKILHLIKNSLYALLKKKSLGARILLIHNNQVLLVKHTYMPGWFTIGGGVDAGESPLQAIHRELQEEVGVTLQQPPKLFSVYHNDFQHYDDYIVLYVAGEHQQKQVTSPEILEARWFALDDLPQDITPATQQRIQEYLGQVPIKDKW